MHLRSFVCARGVVRLLPLTLALAGITCATAGEGKKQVTPAVKTTAKKTVKPATAPAMTIERESEGAKTAGPSLRTLSSTTVESSPAVTIETLDNGLIMVTPGEPLMTTMTVSKTPDGKLVYRCDQDHPKGPHSHAPKGPAGGEK